eukprot:scaffold86429_cov54-Attheya_sp.AAC.1
MCQRHCERAPPPPSTAAPGGTDSSSFMVSVVVHYSAYCRPLVPFLLTELTCDQKAAYCSGTMNLYKSTLRPQSEPHLVPYYKLEVR